ncbi:MAG: tetratricopeptide repeat protein [Pseudomonadales bacterium]|nr:tetratricopeptide repeat protein [Pseudomonadales bacterium]
MQIPADDPVLRSPAMALLEEADQAREAGDAVTAGRRLERALNLAPGSTWIYRQLAELRLEQGEPAAAEGFIRRALRHAGSADDQYRAALYELLAESLSRQGDWQGAAGARESAVKLR